MTTAPTAPSAFNDAQQALADLIDANDVTIALGAAGTGKTYVAVAKAVEALNAGTVRNIVFCRPVIADPAGLGALPGNALDKMVPYMGPLLAALEKTYGPGARNLVDDGTVELTTVSGMRGRSLADSFLVLDDAQDATAEELKLVMTRLGPGSKIVIAGDPSQTSLDPASKSGLSTLAMQLGAVSGAAVYKFEPPPPAAPATLAPFIGREIEMVVEQAKMPMNGMTVVQTVPADANVPLLQDIRRAAIEGGRAARIVYPNKVPGPDSNPNGIDIYIVLHDDGKWRTSLARSGLQNAPRKNPIVRMRGAEIEAIPEVVAQGLAKKTAPMKAVRFKPPGR